MKNIAALRLIGIFMFLASCAKNQDAANEPPLQKNAVPVAVARADKMIWLPADSVVLNGSGSSGNDHEQLIYQWTQLEGPGPALIDHPDSAIATARGLIRGAYDFQLTVTDKSQHSSKASLKVLVNDTSSATRLSNYHPNVVFYFRDPTGGLDTAKLCGIEGFAPRIVLARVKIANYPDAEIEGFWSQSCSPSCPISSMYIDATAYGSFELPPGTYTWTAESVATNLKGLPLVPESFVQYWATPHHAEGTIKVMTKDDCIIMEIKF